MCFRFVKEQLQHRGRQLSAFPATGALLSLATRVFLHYFVVAVLQQLAPDNARELMELSDPKVLASLLTAMQGESAARLASHLAPPAACMMIQKMSFATAAGIVKVGRHDKQICGLWSW